MFSFRFVFLLPHLFSVRVPSKSVTKLVLAHFLCVLALRALAVFHNVLSLRLVLPLARCSISNNNGLKVIQVERTTSTLLTAFLFIVCVRQFPRRRQRFVHSVVIKKDRKFISGRFALDINRTTNSCLILRKLSLGTFGCKSTFQTCCCELC